MLAFSCKKTDILGSSSGTGEPARLQRLLPVLPQDGDIPEVRILVKESDWKTLLDAYLEEGRLLGSNRLDLASWGNHGEYRLLKSGSNNFFQVKAGVISAL